MGISQQDNQESLADKQRVLPADVYDTLELSALAFGGIGSGDWFEDSPAENIPLCISGHATFVGDGYDTLVRSVILSVGLGILTNDVAVPAINRRKGRPASSRVSWKEYTRELNIVRGD